MSKMDRGGKTPKGEVIREFNTVDQSNILSNNSESRQFRQGGESTKRVTRMI